MFETVFGYDKNKSNESQGAENIPISTVSTPYVAAGYEANSMIGNYGPEYSSDLPEVVLEQVPGMMRAADNQESARVIMETRVIQNLIYSYFGIVKKNISDFVPKTIMAFLINESHKIA